MDFFGERGVVHPWMVGLTSVAGAAAKVEHFLSLDDFESRGHLGVYGCHIWSHNRTRCSCASACNAAFAGYLIIRREKIFVEGDESFPSCYLFRAACIGVHGMDVRRSRLDIGKFVFERPGERIWCRYVGDFFEIACAVDDVR